MHGLISYGAYVPRSRLQRSAIKDALASSGGKGTRAVASYDEDATSLAVEACRTALRGRGLTPERLYLATTSPAYLDKTNAATVHAALGLRRDCLAVDMGGAPRSAVGALLAGADSPVMTVAALSDVRTGLPGSADENGGGDAAAALVFGPGNAIAHVLATASSTDEFLERWRTPGATASRTWEDRFSEHVYAPLAHEAFTDALKEADLIPAQVDHLVVVGLAARAVASFAKGAGVPAGAVSPRLTESVGNPGGAQLGLLLADVLDRAEAGQTIVLVQLADGASVVVLRTTEHLPERRSPSPVADQIANGDDSLTYGAFLTWKGMLDREPPRRPEPDAPAGPPSFRSRGFKLSFRATECDRCGTVNLPPSQVCFSCHTAGEMRDKPMMDAIGTVVTFTVDRLAFTPSPPMVAVVVDFDGGGRFRCELADAGPEDVRIGMRVEPTFRRLLTADGVHNYFWKVRPV